MFKEWCLKYVSQRSVLGLILFNICINEIVYASEIYKLAQFADDTNVLFSNKNYEYVENTVSEYRIK